MAQHILSTEQIPFIPTKGKIPPDPPLEKGGIGGDTEIIPPYVKGGGGDFSVPRGPAQLETALEEVILEKTEGVPFYIEEFIKSLKDLGFIERKDAVYRIAKELQSARIPSTIQDIIMARVDALPEGAKELLQVGSLIEREFSYKLIKDVMNIPEDELLRHLSILKDAELLYERGIFPDSTLIFKHSLTREVVSGTLLERKKKDIHGAIGRAMEEVYKDALAERFSALAEHFREAGDYVKAARYYRRSARKAQRSNAYLEAAPFAKEEIFCLDKLPVTLDIQKRIIDARVNLAWIYQSLNHPVEVKDAVAPVIDLAEELHYQRPAIYLAMAFYLGQVEENPDEASRYRMEAIRIAQEENDFVSLVRSYYLAGLDLGTNCEFAEGEAYLARALEFAEAANDVTGIVGVKSVMAGSIYALSGRLDEALKYCGEALQLATQVDDSYLKCAAYGNYGLTLVIKGLFTEAEENMMLGRAIVEKTDNAGYLINGYLLMGVLLSMLGRYGEAQECCDVVLAVNERSRFGPSQARIAKIWKVAARVLGRLDTQIDEVLNFDINEIKMLSRQGTAAHGMGKIFLNIDDAHMAEAESWIKKAIEIDERHKMPWHLATDYCLYAEFFKKKADTGQAKEKLGKAIELMRSIGADGWVKKYEEELAGL